MTLAPMHDVTDTVFRQIICLCGKPDVLFTEFICVDGICNPKSQKKIIEHYFRYSKKEKPIIAQIWGSDPEKFYKSARIIKKLGFDGIDINMGCPDKTVVKNGGGAALILNPKLAVKIIKRTKEGAGGLPVSVKTRIGYDKIITAKWIKELVKAKPDAIIVHGRTKKEMSRVPAHWDEIEKAGKIIKKAGIISIGNGDVKTLKEAQEKSRKYNLDGIMIGRGALVNPWIFSGKEIEKITPKERKGLAIKHSVLFEKTFKRVKHFHHLRKHLASYISGFSQAKEIRSDLMSAKNTKEVKKILKP